MKAFFGLIVFLVIYFVIRWLFESGLYKYVLIGCIIASFIYPPMIAVLGMLLFGTMIYACGSGSSGGSLPDRGVSPSDLHDE